MFAESAKVLAEHYTTLGDIQLDFRNLNLNRLLANAAKSRQPLPPAAGPGGAPRPTPAHRDRRAGLPYAKSLGVLLRSIIVERKPIYRQRETVRAFAPALYGLIPGEVDRLSADRIGRALDQLFEADRAALLTEVVIAVNARCGVRLGQFHND